MTIDESIINKKKMLDEWEQELFLTPESEISHINNCTSIISGYKKEIEWLEELKVFKELYPYTNIKSSLKTNYNNGWNDAIDNFKDKLLANEVVDKSVVRRVATQLKV